MTHTFTSLRHPLEKLLEAEYFLARMAKADGLAFQFELNAYLAACRSVDEILKHAFKSVPGFEAWYQERLAAIKTDKVMSFFLKLRNLSQHAGPVSYVSGCRLGGGWTYRFVHAAERVPDELRSRDIGACCAEQLQKVARLVRHCAEAFPFDACPAAAFTPEGLEHLGCTISDAERAVGLPEGYSDVPDFDLGVRLKHLRREIEPLDWQALDRLATGSFKDGEEPLHFPTSGGGDLLDDVAALIDPSQPHGIDARHAFLQAVGVRINRQIAEDE